MKANKGFGKPSWRTSAYAVLVLCATTTLPAQSFTVLHIFDMTDGEAANALVQGTDGILYGTTFAGGPSYLNLGLGTVFTLTPSGTLTTLYSFCPQDGCSDGEYPSAALMQGPDGNFYGTTSGGGASTSGTVFTITPSGTLTTLHNFDGTDGADSQGALVLGANGKFYGTTFYGGAGSACSHACGTVFAMTPSGTLTTLHKLRPSVRTHRGAGAGGQRRLLRDNRRRRAQRGLWDGL